MSKASKRLLLPFVTLCALVLGQELPSEIILFVTYRDFLPIHCLNDPRVSGGTQFLEDSWDLPVSSLQSSADSCGAFLENGRNNGFTQDLIDLEISGHPDFEAAGLFVVQAKCSGIDPDLGLNFPIGTCIFEEGGEDHQVVNQRLLPGHNGLPSIQYCKNDEGDDTRCGFVGNAGRQTQTTKGNFDKWYNDDPKFNRRVGQRLALTGDGNGKFEFIDRGPDSPDFDEDNDGQFGPLDMFKIDGSREIQLTADPSDVPAWPQSATRVLRGSKSLRRGYWFTSEIHTTFEFRQDQEMTFSFAGDDDFYAFINGKLAVDVGGMHGRRVQTINLLDGNDDIKFFELLGLEDRQVYTLDIYHAERQRVGSNFQLETTLFAACNVQQSGGDSVNFERDFNDPALADKFALDGVELQGRNIQLLSSDQTFSATHIFTKTQENLAPGFDVNFLARIDGDTEGFAFVIQADGVVDYPKTIGRNFNLNVPNSLAVVFDLCVPDEDSPLPCPEQQVRLHFPDDSNATNNAEFVLAEEGGTVRVYDRVVRNLKRDEAFPVNIVFFGEKPDFLEVYVNNSLYLRQSNFNLEEVIGSAGAHVGFVTSTLDKAANIVIEDFRLSIVEVDSTRTRFREGEENKEETILADGVDITDGFVIFTEDACTDEFQSGTLEDFIDAKYIELPNENGTFFGSQRTVVDALILDNLDGTYNLQLQTEVPGDYELIMTFGDKDEDNCVLEVVTENITEEIGGVEVITSTTSVNFLGSTDRCALIENFEGTVTALEVTLPPTEAPIALDLDNVEFDPLPFVGAGGGLFFLILLFASVFLVYRRKWRKEKNFVESGNAYKLELNTHIAGGEEYSAVGNAVLDSQQEILALQATAANNLRTEEISQLQNENQELKEMIRSEKHNGYTAQAEREQQAIGKKRKVEF